jgi:HSP20 family protein
MKQEEKGKDYCEGGRSFDSFERSFQVPEGIGTDKIAASFENGILSVTCPRARKHRSRRKRSK